MLYETRMLEREQAAGKAGYEQGMQNKEKSILPKLFSKIKWIMVVL